MVQFAVFFTTIFVATSDLLAQGTISDYKRALKLREITKNKVFKQRVDAHWFSDNVRFWYRNDLADGRREFVLINAETGERGKAFDQERVAAALIEATGQEILAERLDKLPALSHPVCEKRFVVRYSDLDINQHVNNVKFVEWIVESLPPGTLKALVASELEINFLAEAFHEDRILAACCPQDPDNTIFHHRLTRQQDGRELARAITKWRRID